MTRYLRESHNPGDPLEWWKQKEGSFPNLAALARKYLAIPASSVSAERIFSLAGNLISKKICRLSPDTVDMLIFLNKNRKEATEKKPGTPENTFE